MTKKVKLAVLIGRGGRLPAIYKCCQKIKNLDLVLVVSHKKESPGINLARRWGIESFYCMRKAQPSLEFIPHRTISGAGALDMRNRPHEYLDSLNRKRTRRECEKELAGILKKRKINLIVMAGWDLIMSAEFLKQFPMGVINIHPSLCPAFPGMNAEKQAMDYGAKYTGSTLHFVDPGVDTGQIILQKAVEIKPTDTLKSLQRKIHKKEEEILCQGIKLFARGKLKPRSFGRARV